MKNHISTYFHLTLVVQYPGVQVYNNCPFNSSELPVSFAPTTTNTHPSTLPVIKSVFMPLFTWFSLRNGLHMFTAWPYWFSMVHANFKPIVAYRPDQGNQLCTIAIRAILSGYQLHTSFLPSVPWDRHKRWEFPPPNGSHEQSD